MRRCLYTLSLISFPGAARLLAGNIAEHPMKKGPVKKVLVIWYSQAGHTERNGKLIAATLAARGLKVEATDYRSFNSAKLSGADLIIVGTPVYYYDVPVNVRQWISSLPEITGIPVAAYVTYGGEGGNQYNASCSLAELLASRGGVPVAIDTFRNMSTYPPTWAAGHEQRVLDYSYLPDRNTYKRVRAFALKAGKNADEGKKSSFSKMFDFREAIKGTVVMWAGFKLFSGGYAIDKKTCTRCGICVRKCPVGAIDLSAWKINEDTCIACMGCVNNCPVDAVDITFMGKRLYGFFSFLKKKNITIKEPVT